jgi:heme a synthase
MKFFRIFSAAAASLAFAQVVLGSWVRINGDGMTCPDWPLCRGTLVPQLIGGVVLEWTHRTIALAVGAAIVAAFVAGWRMRRKISGVTPALFALIAVFALQVLVGGITIRESNSPPSVALHWACALLLLVILTALAVLAREAPSPNSGLPAVRTGAGVLGIAGVAFLAYLTTCIGAYVSSSGAGLACAGFPGCGDTFAGASAAQWAQMLHRAAAAAFVLSALVTAPFIAQNGMSRVGVWFFAGTALALLQGTLGAANVALRMPPLLREAHAGNAALTFIVFAVATWLAMLEPLPVRSEVSGLCKTHASPTSI